ncbi:NACHT domain-containing protein [Lentzea waywayandensis]|uniref:NACHT domain-containing protein n=2 Tax=Lentzea waywayandensis TaxID=84724 RepID=A0A1I6FGM1_9PSEU|nr:NACHT domain-containing protein [Lentzea waywayandensis]
MPHDGTLFIHLAVLVSLFTITAMLVFRFRLNSGREPSVSELCDELAVVLRAQWRAEESVRRVHDPVPMPVIWRTESLESPLQDHWVNVVGRDRPVVPSELDGGIDRVHEVFARIPTGRLVVLGRSGAGKSVLATRLTVALLDARKPGERVPVLLPASTWNPQAQRFHEWMAVRLAIEHPALRARRGSAGTVADQLVGNGHVLPVLDGLDEIAPELRDLAIRRCNADLHAGDPIVVTCRSHEYQALVDAGDVLTGAAVVELRPLSVDALAQYLPRTTRRVRAATDRTSLWEPVITALAGLDGGPLREVLATPLMASLARVAYSETQADPVELLDRARFPTAERLSEHLLDALVPATRPESPGDSDQETRRWITTLASMLSRRGSREFAWWELHHEAPRAVRGLVAVALGLCTGWTVALIAGIGVAVAAAVLVAPLAFLVTLPQRTEPAEVRLRLRGTLLALRLRFTPAPRPSRVLRSAGPVGWTVAGGAVIVALGVSAGPLGLFWAIGGVVLAVVLDAWLDVPSDIRRAHDPWTLLRADRTAALIRGTSRGVVIGLASSPVVGPGAAAALFSTVAAGSILHTAWGKFAVARAYFAMAGRFPLRLRKFLIESHKRGILRRVGPMYEFRHASLQNRLSATAE